MSPEKGKEIFFGFESLFWHLRLPGKVSTRLFSSHWYTETHYEGRLRSGPTVIYIALILWVCTSCLVIHNPPTPKNVIIQETVLQIGKRKYTFFLFVIHTCYFYLSTRTNFFKNIWTDLKHVDDGLLVNLFGQRDYLRRPHWYHLCCSVSQCEAVCWIVLQHSCMEVTQMKCVTVNVCTWEGVSMCANWCVKNAWNTGKRELLHESNTCSFVL